MLALFVMINKSMNFVRFQFLFIKTRVQFDDLLGMYLSSMSFKGTYTVSLRRSVYIINQKPMIPRTDFHCITTWVAHSSR